MVRKKILTQNKRKDASEMNNKTLGDIYQEINDEFSEMEPTNIDHLEDRVLAAMDKLGSYLMESKISDWNTQIRHIM
jgi:hypothetical protein